MERKHFLYYFIIFAFSILSCKSFGLYKDLSNRQDVLFINYYNGCRFCKTLIDYINQVYAFLECSLSYDVRQRFKIRRGRSDGTFAYIIAHQGSDQNIIKTYPGNIEEFFIVQNKNGSNIIISAKENICLTNPISINTQPYHISPALNNINLMFTECNFDGQKIEQEFYIESSIQPWFFKGSINLYYINTSTLISSSDLDQININYPDYRFLLFYGNDKKISFIPTSASFDIELPINEDAYYLGNNYETIPFAPSCNCIYSAIPKNSSSSTFLSPFHNKNRCEANSAFFLEYYIEILNKVEFKFINITLGNYLDSSYLLENSDIIFTNGTNGKIHKLNLAESIFPSFMGNLSYGNYTTSLTIKTNPNFESVFGGLNFSINDCSFITLNIPLREKINSVSFTIVKDTDGSLLSTSYFQLNTNIVFTRNSNGQVYSYNVGSGNSTNFSILLHHDSYTITSTDNFNWTRLTNSVAISGYSSVAFSIVLKEKTSQATFNFKFSNLGNEITNVCVFQSNSQLTLRLTDNRIISHTVNVCSNSITMTMFLGTWIIESYSLSTSPYYTYGLNPGHSFYIGSTNNSNFDISLTKVKITSYATFSFKFSNLSNQLGDTCIFQMNTPLVFKLTDNSTVSYTVSQCSSNLSVYLYVGTYVLDNFTIASNSTYSISMNPSQSFVISNSNNSYFDIFLTKVTVTSYATFSFKFSNLSNQLGDTCIFQMNTPLVFKLTDNSTVSQTVSQCSSTISLNLLVGTYVLNSFTIASNANYSISMNPNQSFVISNGSNSSFDVFLTKITITPPQPGDYRFADGTKTYVHGSTGNTAFNLVPVLPSVFEINIKMIDVTDNFITIGVSDKPLIDFAHYIGHHSGEVAFGTTGHIFNNGAQILPSSPLTFLNGAIITISGNNGTVSLKVNGIASSDYSVVTNFPQLYLSFTFVNAGNTVEIV